MPEALKNENNTFFFACFRAYLTFGIQGCAVAFVPVMFRKLSGTNSCAGVFSFYFIIFRSINAGFISNAE